MQTMMDSFSALDDKPYEAESHRQIQEGADKGIQNLIGLVNDVATRKGMAGEFRAEFAALADDETAFIAAARRVITTAPSLPPALAVLDSTLTGMEDNLRRFNQMMEAEAGQEERMKGVVRSTTGGLIGRRAVIKGASSDYLESLEKALAPFSEGAPDPVSVHKPLTLRKPASVS